MKNLLVKNSLSLLIAASLSQTAQANDVEEITVTASPIIKTSDAVNQPVAILSKNKLRQAAASTIGETLQGILGVSSASFGPGVGLPVIRGQSDNRIKVMQDSIGTMDAASASPDHAITIEPLLASRVEVLRGPAALRYGSGAIGGVVNVLDKRIPHKLPQGIEGGVDLRHGTVNEEDTLVASVDGSLGKVAWHMDGTTRNSDNLKIPGAAAQHAEDPQETTHGYISNTDADSQAKTLGMSYIDTRGFIGFSVNTLTNNYGIPPGTHEHHDEEGSLGEDAAEQVRIDLEQTRHDLTAELNDPFAGIEKVSLRMAHNDYTHTELENGEPGTRFTNDAWEGRVELIHLPFRKLKGALGLQAADRSFAAIGAEAFIPQSDIQNLGVFMVEEISQGEWIYELGARLEQQSIQPKTGDKLSHDTVNFSGSTMWHFRDTQRISLGLAQSQRAPSIEELLAGGSHPATNSYLVGEPNLTEETSNNIELGYHWHSPNLKTSINVYSNQIDDFIYARATGNEVDELPEYKYLGADATFSGVEAELSVAFRSHWNWRLFSDYVDAKLDAGGKVPRIPPLRYGTGLEFNRGAWQAGLTATESTAQDQPGENESATESYTRVDGRLSYTLSRGEYRYLIFLKGTNLLNEEIRNATSFLREVAPEGGRGWQLGVGVNF